MLLKTDQVDNKTGKTIYEIAEVNKKGNIKRSGKFTLLQRSAHRLKSNIPNGVIGRFLKPMDQQIWEGDMRKMLLHNIGKS